MTGVGGSPRTLAGLIHVSDQRTTSLERQLINAGAISLTGRIYAGDGISIEGSGTPADPMIISAGSGGVTAGAGIDVTAGVVSVEPQLQPDLPAIPAGSDLNTLAVTGWYIQNLSANATLPLNYPVARAGHLQVSAGLFGTGSDFYAQTYTEYAPVAPATVSRQWRRTHYNGSWTAWSLVSGTVHAEASRSTAVSYTSGTAFQQQTGLALDVSQGDISYASSAFTIAVPGLYLVEGNIIWAPNATLNRVSSVFVNGANPLGATLFVNAGGNSSIATQVGTIRMAAGDVVDLRGWQNSGGNLNASSAYLHITRLSD